jgi:hypothetical protein
MTTASHSTHWKTPSSIEGLRPATQLDLDRAANQMFPGAQAKYLFESGPDHWRVFEGALDIEANFLCDEFLLVFGDVHVKGDYDDHHGSGAFIVMDDLTIGNCLQWGTMYVQGCMTSTGLVFAYYNDHTFEVAGIINAIGVVYFDKAGSLEQMGNVGFYLNSFDDHEQYGDHLLFLDSELFLVGDGIEENTKMHDLYPDFDLVSEWVRAGRSPFRAAVAPHQLLNDIDVAMNYSSSAQAMLDIMDNDILLPRLMALRYELPKAIREKLSQSQDIHVQKILAEMPSS